MSTKHNVAGRDAHEPAEVFRQFAWHLAGSLAAATAGTTRPGVKPAKGPVKR